MKKTPTIFKRDPLNLRELLDEPHPDCEWVFAGEGTATQKYDGTCCLIDQDKLYKRRELKEGQLLPPGFIQADSDDVTGKTVGWVPVDPKNPEDKWHIEAFQEGMPDGTYELLGPNVQGNPEGFTKHILFKHSSAACFWDVPRTYAGLREWMGSRDIEGLVFHHPDGRMAKIKKRDYGQKRK